MKSKLSTVLAFITMIVIQSQAITLGQHFFLRGVKGQQAYEPAECQQYQEHNGARGQQAYEPVKDQEARQQLQSQQRFQETVKNIQQKHQEVKAEDKQAFGVVKDQQYQEAKSVKGHQVYQPVNGQAQQSHLHEAIKGYKRQQQRQFHEPLKAQTVQQQQAVAQQQTVAQLSTAEQLQVPEKLQQNVTETRRGQIVLSQQQTRIRAGSKPLPGRATAKPLNLSQKKEASKPVDLGGGGSGNKAARPLAFSNPLSDPIQRTITSEGEHGGIDHLICKVYEICMKLRGCTTERPARCLCVEEQTKFCGWRPMISREDLHMKNITRRH